jgi:hypothetical protein
LANSIFQHVTYELLKYMHLTKDEKLQLKSNKKLNKVNPSEKYFGVLPQAFKMLMENRKKGS